MLFGTFKTKFFQNLDILWEWRQNTLGVGNTITREDVALLCYGSENHRKQHPEFPLLVNAIGYAFSKEKVKDAWDKKLGVYPIFNRAALTNKAVRHERIHTDGSVNTNADPEAQYLEELTELNKLVCAILDAAGYNGSLFLVELPVYSTEKREARRTAPRSRARQDAIETAKSQGGLFQRTGGMALTDQDVFASLERKELRAKLKEMKESKALRLKATEYENAAFVIIESEKKESDYTSPDLKALIAWKTGKPCPSKLTSKALRKAFWLEVKDRPVKQILPWNDAEEEVLSVLEKKMESAIEPADTLFGRHRELQKMKAASLVAAMSPGEKEAFLHSLQAV